MTASPAAAPPKREPADRRLSTVLILVLVLAVTLCLAAWWTLFVAPKGTSFIPAPLHSVLVANYGVDPSNTRVAVLDLNVVGAIIRDQSASPRVDREATFVSALESPVPTVTPLPGTATAIPTNTPSQDLTNDSILATSRAAQTGEGPATPTSIEAVQLPPTGTEPLAATSSSSPRPRRTSTPVALATDTPAPSDTQTPTATEPPPSAVPATQAPTTNPSPATNTLPPPPSRTPVPPPSNTPAPPPTNTPNSYPPPATNTQPRPTGTPAPTSYP